MQFGLKKKKNRHARDDRGETLDEKKWAVLRVTTLALGMALILCGCDRQTNADVRHSTPAAMPSSLPSPVVMITRASTPTTTAALPVEATVPPAPTVTQSPYDDPSYYYGGMRITMDNVGQEITLKKRQDFMLDLGEDYAWVVMTSPEGVISLNMNYTPQPGEQGLYVARNSGKTVLRATGEPKCRQLDPPCGRPDVLFRISVVVE